MKNSIILFFFLMFSLMTNAQSNIEFTTLCGDTILCSTSSCQIPDQYQFTAQAQTDCATNPFIIYSYAIDIDNNGFFDQSGNGNSINLNMLEIGNHRVIFYASDLCGTNVTCEQIVIIGNVVPDCSPPSIICSSDTTIINIPLSGVIEVDAADIFNGIISDNCFALSELQLSFSNNTTDTHFEFYCEDFNASPDSIYTFDFWVTDPFFYQANCSQSFRLADNHPVCSSLYFDSIPVCIQTLDGITLTDVEFNHTSLITDSVAFDGDCYMTYPNNAFPYISPSKSSDYFNGVTVYDIILLKRHIFQIELLTSPYQVLAGDRDRSGNVSIDELKFLQWNIASQYLNFTRDSWNFVLASHVFPNVNAINSPDRVYINELDTATFPLEFIGVKIGDVDNNAIPNGHQIGNNFTSTDTLNFCVKNQLLTSGDTVSVPVTSNNFQDIMGIQGTFTFDTNFISLASMETQNLPNLNGFYNFSNGTGHLGFLGFAWSELIPEGLTLGEDVVFFTFNFIVKEDCWLSEVLDFNSSKTPAEAYHKDGFIHAQLDFCQTTTVKNISLSAKTIQVSPNPFSEKTTLSFYLEKANDVYLEIFDVNGRTIFSQQKNRYQGEHQIEISKKEIPQSGIYFYKIVTSDAMFSGKIMVE